MSTAWLLLFFVTAAPSLAFGSEAMLPAESNEWSLKTAWQTLWFRVIGAIMLGALWTGLVWGLLHCRHKQAERKWQETQRVTEETLIQEQTCRLGAEQAARSLTRRLFTAQDDERRRVARELHDDVTQRLARLAIDAHQMEHGHASGNGYSKSMREELVQLSEDVHRIAYRLHPAILEDLGLVEAVRAECDHFSRRNSVRVEVKTRTVPGDISEDAALALFRVAEEALHNVASHAHATSVEVSIAGVEDGLQLAVCDDGIGFELADDVGASTLGLAGMRERMNLVRGELDIESAPGEGTTIIAWAPLQEASKS